MSASRQFGSGRCKRRANANASGVSFSNLSPPCRKRASPREAGIQTVCRRCVLRNRPPADLGRDYCAYTSQACAFSAGSSALTQ